MTQHERSVLIATCLSSLGSFYTMTVAGFALPQIQQGLAISEDDVGALFALMRAGTLFSLIIAVLADRLGRRRLLIASVAGCALFNVATAFSQSGLTLAWLQFGARFFVGAQVLLAVVVVSEELSAKNRGWGLGVLTAVGSMGGALTIVAFVFVEQLPYGWRFLFVIGGGGLLCVPWLWRSLQETRRFSEQQSDADAERNEGSLLRPLVEIARKSGWRLAAMVGIVAPAAVVIEPGITFVSKHLQQDLGYSPAQVAGMLALCGIGSPVGNILAGSLSDRYGRKPVTILSTLILSGAMALFYNSSDFIGVAVGLMFLLMSIGGIAVLHGAIATELFSTAFRSTAAGIREAVGGIGASLGLWGLSLLYATTHSHPESITWILILTPISPLIILFIPETARRDLDEI